MAGNRANQWRLSLVAVPGSVRAYASSMKRDITPQDEAARMCDLRDRYGF